MLENKHSAPKKQWRKWDAKQQGLFNGLFEQVRDLAGAGVLLHPVTNQRNLSEDEIKTIAWNVAWLAADILRDKFTDEVVTYFEGSPIASVRLAARAA